MEGWERDVWMCVYTFVAQHSWVYPSIPRDIRMAYTCSDHFDQEFIGGWFACQEILVLPVVLRVGDNALARDIVLGHGLGCRPTGCNGRGSKGGVRILEVGDML
jgi:hypothetical protein